MTARYRSGLSALVAGIAAVWLLSCDLSVAPGTVYSISRLQLPSPGLVVGDTMRDSAGAVAPIEVIAYDASGDVVTSASPYYIVLDTLTHLVGGNLLVGDFVGAARVIGGISSVQTLPETVKVTLQPDTIIPADSVRHVKTYSILADSVATSPELATLVQNRSGATPTLVDAVIVRYSVVSAPAAAGTTATVSLMNGSRASSVDTTSSGRAGRTLRLHISQLTSTNADSAVVRATALYRGVPIGIVEFTVVFMSQ